MNFKTRNILVYIQQEVKNIILVKFVVFIVILKLKNILKSLGTIFCLYGVVEK